MWRARPECRTRRSPGSSTTDPDRLRRPRQPGAKVLLRMGKGVRHLHEVHADRRYLSRAGPTETSGEAAATSAHGWSCRESGAEIDRRGDDDRSQREREQCVPERRAPDLLRLDVRVRHLEGHADREGQVGEVTVVRWFGVVEVDASWPARVVQALSLIHISEPTRLGMISYAVFCLKKKKT